MGDCYNNGCGCGNDNISWIWIVIIVIIVLAIFDIVGAKSYDAEK